MFGHHNSSLSPEEHRAASYTSPLFSHSISNFGAGNVEVEKHQSLNNVQFGLYDQSKFNHNDAQAPSTSASAFGFAQPQAKQSMHQPTIQNWGAGNVKVQQHQTINNFHVHAHNINGNQLPSGQSHTNNNNNPFSFAGTTPSGFGGSTTQSTAALPSSSDSFSRFGGLGFGSSHSSLLPSSSSGSAFGGSSTSSTSGHFGPPGGFGSTSTTPTSTSSFGGLGSFGSTFGSGLTNTSTTPTSTSSVGAFGFGSMTSLGSGLTTTSTAYKPQNEPVWNPKTQTYDLMGATQQKYNRDGAVYHAYYPDAVKRHDHIMCDICGHDPIVGVRYKCDVCDNVDLCETCYKNFKGRLIVPKERKEQNGRATHHSDHPMTASRRPNDY